MTGIPSQLVSGFPDGVGRTGGADEVSVGGAEVFVGFMVGVIVGSGVEVGKLVAVGTGVSVGFSTKALQDANPMTKIESIIDLKMVFIYFLTFVLMFIESP
jgi:hypothetical protein